MHAHNNKQNRWGHSYSHLRLLPLLPISILKFEFYSHSHGIPVGFSFPLGIPFQWSSLDNIVASINTVMTRMSFNQKNWGPVLETFVDPLKLFYFFNLLLSLSLNLSLAIKVYCKVCLKSRIRRKSHLDLFSRLDLKTDRIQVE